MTGPAHASSLQLNADGSFAYTSPPFFYGEDTFTYRVNDGTAYSEIATVHITVSQPGSQDSSLAAASSSRTAGSAPSDSWRKCRATECKETWNSKITI